MIRMKLLSIVGWAAMAFLIPATVVPSAEAQMATTTNEFLVYIGTYTGRKSQGIYVCRLNAANGKLTSPALAAETPNPTFLAIHPRGSALYAANEVRDGFVSAFAMDPKTGQLTFLNKQSSRGNGPCYLSVDHTGHCVLVANYGSGSIATLPIEKGGRLDAAGRFIQHTGSSVNPQRQRGPHAHWIDVSPDNHFAFACDLGLDKVLSYRFEPASCALTPNDPPFETVQPGSGPRHLAFHPNGHFAYVINEMSNTVTAFLYRCRSR